MKTLANGIMMNYEVSGSGKWLTLIHGMGDNLNAWWQQVPVFSQHHRVLTYDVRGHGETELTDEPITSQLWAEDLYGLLQALGIEKTYLLGYSMGGSIALRVVVEHPQVVEALILANSGVRPRAMSEEEMRQMAERREAQLRAIREQGLGALFDQWRPTLFSPGFAESHPEVLAKYREVFVQNRPEGYLKVSESMPRGELPDASQVSCPTLALVGEYEAFAGPEAARAIQETIRGAQVRVLPTGHAAAIEQPELFNQMVLEFLASLPG